MDLLHGARSAWAGGSHRDVRFVYDIDEESVLAAQALEAGQWQEASASQLMALDDFLSETGPEAVSAPKGFGFSRSSEPPEWFSALMAEREMGRIAAPRASAEHAKGL